MVNSNLSSIFVPIVGLVFSALTMVLSFLYIQKDEIL
uniref:Photosystem I reaction center subunit VIII n=17 Tax=Ephedra TaxID=3387 RepID=A0A8F4TIH7_9SPER|nr:photosystem I subunit VIII [Ephedra equisetina]YP_009694722.1 photosystem I subunit VIII [Ephedra intermedia]YP_009694795.1 photosystem I subunit VIII [Ephedra sinica]YP_010048929.1 photosystem I subunit VIII [Ephedra monosperma]YP_010207342.1 photosystem I subunit VIII [Ephedra przewalskii]YP_010452520.1 photosystem I subunit VIII [Ephedra distachya]YP_010452587.1 photosystem I subunit VIII [Ephedra fedtschenkoae]YP_010452921.1 photosystem I subunit VIII [Ephedra gerardiana]YP_010452988